MNLLPACKSLVRMFWPFTLAEVLVVTQFARPVEVSMAILEYPGSKAGQETTKVSLLTPVGSAGGTG